MAPPAPCPCQANGKLKVEKMPYIYANHFIMLTMMQRVQGTRQRTLVLSVAPHVALRPVPDPFVRAPLGAAFDIARAVKRILVDVTIWVEDVEEQHLAKLRLTLQRTLDRVAHCVLE